MEWENMRTTLFVQLFREPKKRGKTWPKVETTGEIFIVHQNNGFGRRRRQWQQQKNSFERV